MDRDSISLLIPQQPTCPEGAFRVFWTSSLGPERRWYEGYFDSRKKARAWCRKHAEPRRRFFVLHPDNREEPMEPQETIGIRRAHMP